MSPEAADTTGDIPAPSRSLVEAAKRWLVILGIPAALVACVVAASTMLGWTSGIAWWLVEDSHAQDLGEKIDDATAKVVVAVEQNTKLNSEQASKLDNITVVHAHDMREVHATLALLLRQQTIAFCKTTLKGEWLPARDQCLLPDKSLYPPTAPTLPAGPGVGAPTPAPQAPKRRPRRNQPITDLVPGR
tara:strand:- start:319 stop:885 length:567 start_codon:yes stop_codon:yes gene_type:complete